MFPNFSLSLSPITSFLLLSYSHCSTTLLNLSNRSAQAMALMTKVRKGDWYCTTFCIESQNTISELYIILLTFVEQTSNSTT